MATTSIITQNKQQAQDTKTFFLYRIENIFLLNGITALLGWNAVLDSFDYFQNTYEKTYDVSLYFPVPVFVGYAMICIIFRSISLKFSYSSLIKLGIIVSNITLFLLVAVCQIFKNTATGFAINMVFCVLLGSSSNLVQLSFYGMINYFGSKVVSRFTVGTAVSGLALVLLKVVITACFSPSQQLSIMPTVIYFSLSTLFNFFDLFLNIKLFQTNLFKESILKPLDEQKRIVKEEEHSLQSNKQTYIQLLWSAFKATAPYPIIIYCNFVVTFMLFPKLTLSARSSLPPNWSCLMLLTMYNIGDFCGKLAGDFRGSFNSFSIKFLFFARLFFFYSIPLMAKEFTQDDYLLNNNFFPFFNQIIFSFTNGLVINGCFILTFESAPVEYKRYVGIVGCILLQLGISSGTFLAMPLTSIVNPDLQEELMGIGQPL